ncbi:MAG: bifunctional folylpolyglutamate synthase/dihydrofolate synthase [Firmicutes bacterium]|nr:bifunctional folylpolyglutamate synthase/dihydrofolate synthase [Bacillota bacterium]
MSGLGSIPGLERIESLLREMGDPQQGLQCLHIAGTNGKGSTSLMIAEILIASGYRVGRFTSPHLHSYLERFTINGQEISEPDFWSGLEEVAGHTQVMLQRGEAHPTEFEVLTAIAFRYFQQQGVDIVVLEVGMGGSYDSTNVIIPLLSVITGVDFDHTAYLGTSLAEIAGNKAGIIKTGVPVVVGQMGEEAWGAISRRAHALQAPLHRSSSIKIDLVEKADLDGQLLDIAGCGLQMSGVRLSLGGNYQRANLAVALTALQLMRGRGYRVEEASIRVALARLIMPGRFEVICRHPLVILDAAHNPQGARALADSLETLLPGRSKVLVLGLVDDKERDEIIRTLGSNTRAAIVTRPQGLRGENWLEVLARWQEIFPDIEVSAQVSIPEAVNAGLALLAGKAFLLITGSFYVLDQARMVFINN